MWRYFRRHHALNIVYHIAEHNLTNNVTLLSPTLRTEHSPPYRWTESDVPFTDITHWTQSAISLNTLWYTVWRSFYWHHILNTHRHITEHTDAQFDDPFTDITHWIHIVISLNTLTHNRTLRTSSTSHTGCWSKLHDTTETHSDTEQRCPFHWHQPLWP